MTFKIVRGRGKSKPAAKVETGRSRYAGFTKPNIPVLPESAETFTRQGKHVLIGTRGSRLSPDFVSSHNTKLTYRAG